MVSYRSSPHDTLGESPNTMMFGREILMPVDLLFGKTSQLKDVSTPEYVHNLTNRMDKVHAIVRDRLLKAVDRRKRRYDLTCNTREYKVGDGVLLQDNRKQKVAAQNFKINGRVLIILPVKYLIFCIEYKKDYIPNLKLYT
jgi:sugar lactone lactonase YvrE